MEVSWPGIKSELQLWPVSHPWQHWIQATSVTCAEACSNAGSLTHWARAGIQPASSQRQSWVLNLLSHNRNSLFSFLNIFSEYRILGLQLFFIYKWYYVVFVFLFFTIVDLQCSVNFYWTEKWPSPTYVYILFLTLSSIMFHHKWLDIVPCAIQQDLIAYLLQMQ